MRSIARVFLAAILIGIVANPSKLIASTITLDIVAYIDGRDLLILQGDTLQWEHLDFAAVGRWLGQDLPTYISVSQDGTTVLDNYAWYPIWPEPVPGEIRYPAFSSILDGFVPSLDIDSSISFTPTARESLSIFQFPSVANGYSLVLDFNDYYSFGADWYSASITYESNAVPEPSSAMLLATGMVGLYGLYRRRRSIA